MYDFTFVSIVSFVVSGGYMRPFVPEQVHRVANVVLVTLFLAAISLPLGATIAGFDGADPGAEHRELAVFPTMDGSWSSIAGFGGGLSRWFDDHFGFRSRLVRWYGESRLFLLGVSPSAAVIKGREEWFFYGDDNSIEDYVSDAPMAADGMANWRAAVSGAGDWLRARGIAYVFTIAPDKYVVYPEEMPTSIARRTGSESRTDQVYEALRGSRVFSVDVRPALFAAKAHERIYQRTDTHWNDRGALVAYQAIVDAVRAQVPSTPAAWTRADFKPVVRDVEGMDLAGMMGLKRVLREQDLALVPKRPRQARVVEPVGAGPMAEEGRLVTEIPGSPLPRAVIFRDSFMSRLVPLLSEHFSRAVYLWQNDFDAPVVMNEKPDVVIQEIVGRHLYNFIPSPELVPE
jgi:alginate O-acetyltransferase complex protein AlgJ